MLCYKDMSFCSASYKEADWIFPDFFKKYSYNSVSYGVFIIGNIKMR